MLRFLKAYPIHIYPLIPLMMLAVWALNKAEDWNLIEIEEEYDD